MDKRVSVEKLANTSAGGDSELHSWSMIKSLLSSSDICLNPEISVLSDHLICLSPFSRLKTLVSP